RTSRPVGTVPTRRSATPAAPRRCRARRPRSSALQRCQQVVDGALRAHLVPGLGDLALLVDQERRTDDAEVLLAVHALLAPHAVRIGDRVVLIREQREAEPVLGVELLLARG